MMLPTRTPLPLERDCPDEDERVGVLVLRRLRIVDAAIRHNSSMKWPFVPLRAARQAAGGGAHPHAALTCRASPPTISVTHRILDLTGG